MTVIKCYAPVTERDFSTRVKRAHLDSSHRFQSYMSRKDDADFHGQLSNEGHMHEVDKDDAFIDDNDNAFIDDLSASEPFDQDTPEL